MTDTVEDRKRSLLKGLIDHAFLPKKLPNEEENDLLEIGKNLLERVATILACLPCSIQDDDIPRTKRLFLRWSQLQKRATTVADNGKKEKFNLDEELANLQINQGVAFYLHAQNATIWFQLCKPTNKGDNESLMRLVTFRGSLPNDDIMASSSKGTLRVTYPETVDFVPVSPLLLSNCFSKQILHLSRRPSAIAQKTSFKAGKNFGEVREPSFPYLVTEFIPSILNLQEQEEDWSTKIKRSLTVEKKVRDQVNWNHCQVPWRRSGFWMSIKVLLQMSLQEELGAGNEAKSRLLYKVALLQMMTSLFEDFVDFSNNWDLLRQLLNKLTRRAIKISKIPEVQQIVNDETGNYIRNVLDHTFDVIGLHQAKLTSLWQSFCVTKDPQIGIDPLDRTKKDFLWDCLHEMTALDTYLSNETRGLPLTENVSSKKSNCLESISPLIQDLTSLLCRVPDKNENQGHHDLLTPETIWLHQVEHFARKFLTKQHPAKFIFDLLLSYFERAVPLYVTRSSDPVASSRMVVTILKMIQILDEICLEKYRLLGDYATGIDPDYFARLLLPEKNDMDLMKNLGKYFRQRNGNKPTWMSGSELSRQDFSVKFALQCEKMVCLKNLITQETVDATERKFEEVGRMKMECQKLQEQMLGVSHETYYDKKCKEYCHTPNCPKCPLEKELERKRFSVSRYQIPLPDVIDEYQQYGVMFELMIPEELSYLRDSICVLWREILGQSLFKPELVSKNIYTSWSTFTDLSLWREHQYQKFVFLGSTKKPTMESHYGNSNPDVLTSTKESFIVNNGLNCFYFYSTPMTPEYKNEICPRMFSFLVSNTNAQSSQLYETLQFSLDAERQTENYVLANQYNCHQKLTLREFIAFGSVRSGRRIQLRHLYHALSTQSLSIEREAVLALVMETLWELGNEDGLEIHRDFMGDAEAESNFNVEFLKLLGTILEENSENWSNPLLLLPLIFVSIRILELYSGNFPDISRTVKAFLNRTRDILDDWSTKVQALLSKCHDGDTEESRNLLGLQLRIVLCSAYTFNVSSQNSLTQIIGSNESIVFWLQTLSRMHHLLVREKVILNLSPSRFLQNLIRHVRTIIPLNLQDFLHRHLTQDSQALHQFALQNWTLLQLKAKNDLGLSPGWRWESHESLNKRHAFTAIYNIDNHHYNVCVDILRGAFLVDGFPPCHLPENIVQHPTFATFFHSNKFRVQRSKDMTFATQEKYGDHHYTFRMHEDVLVCRQIKAEGDTKEFFELLPRHLFEECLPHDLIQNYTHWYDSGSKVVQFKNVEGNGVDYEMEMMPNITSHNWSLMKCAPLQDIAPEKEYLLSINSTGFKEITEIARRLESCRFIHVAFSVEQQNCNTFTIRVKLWRLNLTFHLDKNGILWSDNYPGYCIPVKRKYSSDCLGTLIGLESGICLEKHLDPKDDTDIKKLVIIPHGVIQVDPESQHQSVTIVTEPELRNPPFFAYEVDQTLRRLKPGKDKSAWLYLAALHGATASPFPDTFTHLTGTEMAIWILQSAAVWSCSPYDDECLNTLKFISSLTPVYQYYPPHLKNMQKIKWPTGLENNSYAAYDGYWLIVQKLLEDSGRLERLFSTSTNTNKNEPQMNSDPTEDKNVQITKLVERSYFRNINLYNEACHLDKLFSPANAEQGKEGKLHSVITQNQNQSVSLIHFAKIRQIGEVCKLADAPSISSLILMTEDFPLPSSQTDETGILKGGITNWLNIKMRSKWLTLYNMALKSEAQGKSHECTLILGAVLYSGESEEEVKTTLSQILNLHNISKQSSNFPAITDSTFPHYCGENFHPLQYSPNENSIKKNLETYAEGFPKSSVDFEEFQDYLDAESAWEKETARQISTALNPIISAWSNNPELTLYKHRQIIYCYSRISRCDESYGILKERFQFWDSNKCVKEFVEDVDKKLLRIQITSPFSNNTVPPPPLRTSERNLNFRKTPFQIDSWETEIENIFGDLGEDIIYSTGNFDERSKSCYKVRRSNCKQLIGKFSNAIPIRFLERGDVSKALSNAGLFVPISPVYLLRHWLRRNSKGGGCQSLSKLVGALAVLWCHQNRFDRLILYQSRGATQTVELEKEEESELFENWRPIDHPEWILLQLELDITIRHIQVKVADHMMSMRNGIMQLNMGEGKTSVVVPMIVSTLSSAASSASSQICRVTVLNSIFATNFNLLNFAVGGLLNRRLYTIPCRRDLPIHDCIDAVEQVYKECLQVSGCVMTLPEHRLSFRLMSYSHFLRGSEYYATGLKFHGIETWLRMHVRDIVDESDEIFSVKYQLIYTTGQQLDIDGGHLRWMVCRKILDLLPEVAKDLSQDTETQNLNQCIEFDMGESDNNPESFTHFRFLTDDEAFHANFYNRLVDKILDEGKSDLFGQILTDDKKSVIRDFLVNQDITEDKHNEFMEIWGNAESNERTLKIFLILSGYLRRGILHAALRKRWRVEYGVKRNGSKMMAVRFRAKDVAAERTEFGHADMAIVLTQLSYYYSGLSDEQLLECFQILQMKTRGPESFYNSWIKNVPPEKIKSESVKSYKGVNLYDYHQRNNFLFPILRKNKRTIDFWLENVVYPKECKVFPGKLVTNAWDLCYNRNTFSSSGFSGTNDTSLLLPPQLTQNDLDVLKNTNLEMERILTRGENQWRRELETGVTCENIIDFMIEDNLRVLIDAGAVMLQLTNEGVADRWLKHDAKLKGVVYFNDGGQLVIKTRGQNSVDILTLSPFKDNLEGCAVYLDDQHTRGTDLKLPTYYRACVTVGTGMRRDKLIQACMRMRKLGKGQTVHFYVTQEAVHKIKSMPGFVASQIGTNHILNWAKQNSSEFEKEGLVHWVMAALSYVQKLIAEDIFEMEMSKNQDCDIEATHRACRLAEHCQEPEIYKLLPLYGTYHSRQKIVDLIPVWFNALRNKFKELPSKCEVTLQEFEDIVVVKCKDHIPNKTFFYSTLDEEQEKELEPHEEREPEVSRPDKETAADPEFNEDLVVHIDNPKRLLQRSNKFFGLAHIFEGTTFWEKIQPDSWRLGQYYVTSDFIRVIEKAEKVDSFLRPLKWFISYHRIEDPLQPPKILMISSYEADRLVDYFRLGATSVPVEGEHGWFRTLHTFSGGRWMQGQETLQNNLGLQLSPGVVQVDEAIGAELSAWVMAPLLIAGGNLFFASLEEQKCFAGFLGLLPRAWTEKEKELIKTNPGAITPTAFIKPGMAQEISALRLESEFQVDPTTMIRCIVECRNEVVREVDHVLKLLNGCAYIGDLNHNISN